MWKYKVVELPSLHITESIFNELGENNWELVQIVNDWGYFKKFMTEEEYILDKIIGEDK